MPLYPGTGTQRNYLQSQNASMARPNPLPANALMGWGLSPGITLGKPKPQGYGQMAAAPTPESPAGWRAALPVNNRMMGNAQGRTTGIAPVDPQAGMKTTNVTGAQTAMSADYSDLPPGAPGMIADQRHAQRLARVQAGQGLGQDYQVPGAVGSQTMNYLNTQAQAGQDFRAAQQGGYDMGRSGNYDTGMQDTLQQSYRQQALDSYRSGTPGGENMIRRFGGQTPPAMSTPFAQRQMLGGGDAAGAAQFAQQAIQRADPVAEAGVLNNDGRQLYRAGDGANQFMVSRNQSGQYALSAPGATQAQIDQAAAVRQAAMDKRGGMSAVQLRRLDGQKSTLDRAVRRGILTRADADQRIAESAKRMGADPKNYLMAGSPEMKQINRNEEMALMSGLQTAGGERGAAQLNSIGTFDATTQLAAKNRIDEVMQGTSQKGIEINTALADLGIEDIETPMGLTSVKPDVRRKLQLGGAADRARFGMSAAQIIKDQFEAKGGMSWIKDQHPLMQGLISDAQKLDTSNPAAVENWTQRYLNIQNQIKSITKRENDEGMADFIPGNVNKRYGSGAY